jgi:hypothetical protein
MATAGVAHVADELLGLGIRIVPHAASSDWEHDLDQQIFTAICGEHLRRKLPSASTSKMRDRWTHHEHEA